MNLNSIRNLDELVADPGKVANLPPEAIPTLRGELARLDTLLLARLLSGSNGQAETGPDGDRLMDVTGAARKLGTSKDYLYRHSSKLPFTVRLGRQLRFSEAGIARDIRQRIGR